MRRAGWMRSGRGPTALPSHAGRVSIRCGTRFRNGARTDMSRMTHCSIGIRSGCVRSASPTQCLRQVARYTMRIRFIERSSAIARRGSKLSVPALSAPSLPDPEPHTLESRVGWTTHSKSLDLLARRTLHRVASRTPRRQQEGEFTASSRIECHKSRVGCPSLD